MIRDEYLKEQSDEEFNSVAAKLKRAQDHIAKLQQENAHLKKELKTLDKKYRDTLRKEIEERIRNS